MSSPTIYTAPRGRSMMMNIPLGDKDLVDTAKGTGQLNTFLAAVEAAGLTSTLKSSINTIYAPSDEAFSKVDVNALLADKAKLEDTIKYHIIPLRVPDEKVIREFRLSNKVTLQGGRVKINVKANPAGGEQLVSFYLTSTLYCSLI